MRRFFYTGFLFFLFSSCSAQTDTSLADKTKFIKYKYLYDVECVDEKIIDNQGNGFENLYGTRNFRVVLHGVA